MIWKLLGIFLAGALVSGQITPQCPSGFSELKFICYKPILGANNFKDAILACTKNGEELMPVQELRYFAAENVKTFTGTTTGLFRVNAIKTDQWLEFIGGKLRPISFSNFPSFNASIGQKGDTLVYHPATPNNLYPIPFDLAFVNNQYALQPLCFKNKVDSEVCDANFEGCCDNGDCLNGKCSCYSGWSATQNCCCKDSTLTISLMDRTTGQKLVNRAVRVLLQKTEFVLISNNEGKIVLDGCSPKLLRVSLDSGAVKIAGYCTTSFSARLPVTQSQEISVFLGKAATLKVQTVSQVTFAPLSDVSVTIDGLVLKTDIRGEISVEKCANEPVVFSVEAPRGYCQLNPFHVNPVEGFNARTILLKPLANVEVNVRDASTCGPLNGAKLMLSKENKTAMTNGNGFATLTDCLLSKSKLTVNVDGFCPSSTDVVINGLATPVSATIDLKPRQSIEVVVRNEKNLPLKDMTVVMGTDDKIFVNITSEFGRTRFPELCYGEAALLTIFGGSFDTELCKSKQQEVVVGSTNFVTVSTDCSAMAK